MSSLAERMFAAGITDLISVIPPGVQLTPSSKIPQAALGKIPGVRLPSGLWSGRSTTFHWRTFIPTIADVRQWTTDGANVGLRTTWFPAVDIDCKDPVLAQMIEDCALAQLGPAPIRTGNPPKRLLLYQTAAPFGRLRLWIKTGSGEHLVEVLGEGQQAVMTGTHPSGRQYEWKGDPAGGLTVVTVDKVRVFLDSLQTLIESAGAGIVEREGDGRRVTHTAGDQRALLAPSLDALREAVTTLPNLDVQFPGRADYLKVGYAIKAAAGPDNEEDGCELFVEWAGRWDGGTTSPELAREDYRRMTGASSVGWSYLAELARQYGFNAAGFEFDLIEGAKPAPDSTPSDDRATMHSDQWLADYVIARYHGSLKYVPQRGTWLVWDKTRWVVDAELLAEDLIFKGLRAVAAQAVRDGVKGAERLGLMLCSAARGSAVAQVARTNRAAVINVNQLDSDPMLLNTPGGIVDLKTGDLKTADPDALCTRMTAVAPSNMQIPQWLRFLDEATGGDAELQGYMQRLCGYCLTGLTSEQQLTFIFGNGQNGKSVFSHTLSKILGDYAASSTPEVFLESRTEKHTTDLAALAGARLVVASETPQGQRWNETRIKSISGGEAITARFMRQDNFTYDPQCKLVFTGNHQPELREVGKAVRRRIHMVPFLVEPKKRDDLLTKKLEAEWPGILRWMIEGCLQWQTITLLPPPVVLQASEDYFEGEDVFGRWLQDCVERTGKDEDFCSTHTLSMSWGEWANARREFVGSEKRLAQALGARGFKKAREKGTQVRGFAGLKLKPDVETGRLVTNT